MRNIPKNTANQPFSCLTHPISRREFLQYSSAAAAALCTGCNAHAKNALPDILLISIDSLRPDHLGCYGYDAPTSPTIDVIAKQGIRFTNAFSTTSWTLPAHAALFTGLYDSAHGLVNNGLRLSSNHITLAQILADNGYQTAGFYGGPYLHPTFGLDKGFHSYQSCMSDQIDHMDDSIIRKESNNRVNLSHSDITGPRTLQKFSAWLDTAENKPLFVFLHMWDPHYDYMPPKKYENMFDPDYSGNLDTSQYLANSAINPKLSLRDLKHIIALYNGEIRFTDDILAQIFTKLKQCGRWDNTLIIILGDHGEEFFEHGNKGHAKTLYDEVIHIPLIFHWPSRLRKNIFIDHVVQINDIMPTILNLLNVDYPDYLQGRPLTDLLVGRPLPERPAFCEMLGGFFEVRAIRTRNGKVIQLKPTDPTCGYFDLTRDPKEKSPITVPNSDQHPLVKQLIDLTQQCLALNKKNTGSDSNKIELDPEMKKRLESLGYIDDKSP